MPWSSFTSASSTILCRRASMPFAPTKKTNLPVVMTREEVAAVISLMDGTAQVVAKLLYGSGLRIMEAVRLRVKNVDFQMKQITVRSGKGDKARFNTFPRHL